MLMSYKTGHTRVAVSSSVLKDDPRQAEIVKCDLIGNAYHVEVAAWLFGHLGTQWGYLGAAPGMDELRAPAAQGLASADASSMGFAPEQREFPEAP